MVVNKSKNCFSSSENFAGDEFWAGDDWAICVRV